MDIDVSPLRARRNAPFAQTWRYSEDGILVDFTGATAALQVRLYGAQPGDSLIDLGVTTTALTEGVMIAPGELTVFISRASLFFLPRGRPGADVTFVYDLIVTLPGLGPEVWAQGPFIVAPAVTQRLTVLTHNGALLTVNGDVLTAR